MTTSSDTFTDRQGILSFFQNNATSHETSQELSQDSKETLVVDSDKMQETNDDDKTDKREIIEQNESSHPLHDGMKNSEPRSIDYQEKSESDEDEKANETAYNSSGKPAGEQKKKDLLATKREELKRDKEMKKQQREEDKRKREEQREEEKHRREEQRKTEKRKREEQREEEKRKREDRKRQKDHERLEAKRQKELDRRQKEEERLKKEEAKRLKQEAKEKAQSRIGTFFKKISDSNKKVHVKSDYEKYFLPFYAKEGVILPSNWPTFDTTAQERKARIDMLLVQGKDGNAGNDDVSAWLESRKMKHGHHVRYTAVAVLQQMTAKEKKDTELQALLSLVPHKYIKFYENIRPPYIGTYSKDVMISVNDPFSTQETGYNYDYDSDLEWVNEEEEDGEKGDIDNLESGEDEEDEEDEEASEGEFDGFLDMEDTSNLTNGPQNGKRKFLGPLIPTVYLRDNIATMDEEEIIYFETVSVKYLIEQQPFPIEPNIAVLSRRPDQSQNTGAHKRLISDIQQEPLSGSSSASASPEKKRSKVLITDAKNLLKLFDEIQNSTFSLGTVTEIAQKNLPQYSKQIIKNTVKEYALRGTGKGDTTRKWEIKNMQHWEELRLSVQE